MARKKKDKKKKIKVKNVAFGKMKNITEEQERKQL